MSKRKLLRKVLSGAENVRFADVVALAEAFGFRLTRVSGSHHIFTHPRMPELLNLQKKAGKAKAYQLRQLLQLVEQYDLPLGEEEK
jgi:predicted RNA binding protein YcfA (HicA-like mRNA interferase family)